MPSCTRDRAQLAKFAAQSQATAALDANDAGDEDDAGDLKSSRARRGRTTGAEKINSPGFSSYSSGGSGCRGKSSPRSKRRQKSARVSNDTIVTTGTGGLDRIPSFSRSPQDVNRDKHQARASRQSLSELLTCNAARWGVPEEDLVEFAEVYLMKMLTDRRQVRP